MSSEQSSMELAGFVGSWKTFDALNTAELYALLKLRQDIFIVEQESLYADMDGKDPDALHYLVTDKTSGELAAAIRLLQPDAENFRIGRVVVARAHRGKRLGQALMEAGIQWVKQMAPGSVTHVSA